MFIDIWVFQEWSHFFTLVISFVPETIAIINAISQVTELSDHTDWWE